VLRLGTWLLGGLIAVYVAFTSWYIVDQGERAVVLRLGAIVGEAGPGAHFKVPWIDTVRKITVQNQNRRYTALEAYSAINSRRISRSACRSWRRIRARCTNNTATSMARSRGSSIRA
jgi:regulator of protease activity HflC (stomatin/prohibitin superfamily)